MVIIGCTRLNRSIAATSRTTRLLLNGGGHSMAAGLTLKADKLEAFE
ncbi:MAG: hypothetical protein COC12_12330, partial [Rhodobacteraceae bacterium]